MKLSFLFVSLLLLFIALASFQNTEDHLISLIKKHYANLYVNNESYKLAVVNKLKDYLQTHPLNQKNEENISLILNELNDGHVLLKNESLQLKNKISDLVFIPGTFFISGCEHSCFPKIPNGKYEILKVGEQYFEDWIRESEKKVNASSPWAKRFRASRLLVSSKKGETVQLQLRNSSGEIFSTQLRFLEEELPLKKCVEGKRLSTSVFYIKIKTLWCDRDNGDIENNYNSDWNQSIAAIRKSDKIIIDLRENNGGDDKEVVTTMSSFIDHSFPLYLYQFLTLNRPGKLQHLLHILPFPFKIWEKKGIDMAFPVLKTKNTFFTNQVNVLISAGCFSSCEGLASAFKVQKRAKLFGTQTHGGAGDPLFFPIAHSSYSINLPTCLTWQADGKLIEGNGITPDYLLEDKLLFTGDFVLEEALKN